jgi:hypothetical protein
MAHHAVHVDHRAAAPADEMVVVVADPVLVASGGAGGLDAAGQACLLEDAEHVVHGLRGNGAEPQPRGPGGVLDVGVGERSRPRHPMRKPGCRAGEASPT